MTKLDEKIMQSLNDEDAALLQTQMNELGVFDALAETFKGKHRFINVFGFILAFAMFGLVVYFGINFFTVDHVIEKLNWLAGFLASLIALAMLKLWFWMEMNRVSLLRDIKRIELHTVLMSRGVQQD